MKHYVRKGRKYDLDEVLPFVDDVSKRKVKKEFDGDVIKISSDRLITFKNKGVCCVECGLEGSFLVKERDLSQEKRNEPFHFNMYGINENGEEVLFTKDHIIPKSMGGANHVSNYQTMCKKCNEEKGNKM